MKKYLPTSYASAAIELVSQGYAHDDVTNVLTHHLRKAKRLSLLPSIVAEIEERVALGDGDIVDVYSAHALDKEEQERIADVAKKLFKTDVTLRTHKDSTLVGGLTLKHGDELIDYSVATLVLNLHMYINQDNQ